MLRPLFSEDLPNGWHYQVDFVHDQRIRSKPFVAVCAFKPPRVMHAKCCEYILEEEL